MPEYIWCALPVSFEVYQRPASGELQGFRLDLARRDPQALGDGRLVGSAQQQHQAGTVIGGEVAGRDISFDIRWADTKVGHYTGHLDDDGRLRGNSHRVDPDAAEPIPLEGGGVYVPEYEYVPWWSGDAYRWRH